MALFRSLLENPRLFGGTILLVGLVSSGCFGDNIEPKTEILPTKVLLSSPTPERFSFGNSDHGVCERLNGTIVELINDDCLVGGEVVEGGELGCISAAIAQKICLTNGSLCLENYEINCRRHNRPAVSKLHPLPETICSGLTVNGIGYPDQSVFTQDLNATCLLDNADVGRTQTCTFLGQPIFVSTGFCGLLTQCVEPKLASDFGQVGIDRQPDRPYETAVWAFPSGAQALYIDLSCNDRALTDSLHHPTQACRAIDINADQNYGNLRENPTDPISTIPPEFVAIAEECGLIWGGRYNSSDNVSLGCDPMEIAYAPACMNE